MPDLCDYRAVVDNGDVESEEFTCPECGYTTDELLDVSDGDAVCESCFEDLAQCFNCDERVHGDLTETVVNPHDICDECLNFSGFYAKCEHCHEWARSPRDTREINGDTICDECVMEHYATCSSCDEWYAFEDGECECDAGQSYQQPCSCGCGAGAGDLINRYSYRPSPDFHGSGPLYFGLEIELEAGDDKRACAELANREIASLGYLKEDGSLDCGFEIVTHPMTFEYARDWFPWEMLGELADAGAQTTAETGLHIHVSRAGFTDASHIYRWMKFVYRNADDVCHVARRESSWASFDDSDRKEVKRFAKGAKDGARYRAINPQNDNTLELRVFASSLEPREVQAALELAHASVEYTRNLTTYDIAHDGGWDWDKFTAWLPKSYSSLAAEMQVAA